MKIAILYVFSFILISLCQHTEGMMPPNKFSLRSATRILKVQLVELKKISMSAILETIGTNTDLCLDRRFNDNAISSLKTELEVTGFTVDWAPGSTRAPTDPRFCHVGRESMSITVPASQP